VLACTRRIHFCPRLGGLSCAVSPKVAVLLYFGMGRRFSLARDCSRRALLSHFVSYCEAMHSVVVARWSTCDQVR
jgi:hypothetical protein